MKVCNSLVFLLLTIASVGYALSGAFSASAEDATVAPGSTVSSPSYRLSSQPTGGRSNPVGENLIGKELRMRTLERLLSKRASGFIIDGTTICAGLGDNGIWRSTDGGATWSGAATQPANRRIRALVIHPNVHSTYFAATYGGGIFTSTDSGNTWMACADTGLSGAAMNAVSLTIDPAGNLYAGTEAGIFRSSDCNSWSAANSGLTVNSAVPPVAIAVDPAPPARLYVGLDGAGVFTSSDRGATWVSAASQPVNKRIKALAIPSGGDSKIYAATYGNGVVISRDHGLTWKECADAGLSNANVGSLLIDAEGKLFAGTEGGVFMSIDGCASWTTLLGGDPQ